MSRTMTMLSCASSNTASPTTSATDMLVALREEPERRLDALGRLDQALALRVLAQRRKNVPDLVRERREVGIDASLRLLRSRHSSSAFPRDGGAG